MKKENEQTKGLSKVNDVTIQLVNENGNQLVPIKPICEALGIDRKAQQDKIEADEFLSSVRVLSPTTGADGKEYKMVCLPFKYVFGWLFTINPKNVKPEAQEAVSKYRIQCYDVLYEYFSEYADFVEVRSLAIEKQLENYQSLQNDFKNARTKMDDAKNQLNKVRSQTFENYKADKGQFKIDFLQEAEPEIQK